MEINCTRKEEREFNRAVTLYHRAGRDMKPEPAKRAADKFRKLGNLKWTEMALELYYELKGRTA